MLLDIGVFMVSGMLYDLWEGLGIGIRWSMFSLVSTRCWYDLIMIMTIQIACYLINVNVGFN